MKNTAIVIGGGIAGLLSARVLAEHFSSVSIVEIDKFSIYPNVRKGAPQSAQPHILLAKGYRILEDFFPNIGIKLSKNGALKIDWVQEFYHFSEAGWGINVKIPSENFSSEVISFTCSRPLLEWVIRQELLRLSNIKIIERHRVTELLYSASQKRVTGVRLKSLESWAENHLLADLTIDASGRRSQAPKWLEKIGFSLPPDTVVNPFLGYTTRRYKEPENYEADWKVMLIAQAPPQTRLGYLSRIENGEWIATLGGYGKDFPPSDHLGFLEFARSLRHQKFYNAIANAEPLSPLYEHRATNNRLRHFDRAELPEGFIAIGDAVCALCPVYGQGMTVSALAAKVLQNELKKRQKKFSQHSLCSSSFQKSLAMKIAQPWLLATTQDLRFPSTQAERNVSRMDKFIQWYTKKLTEKTTSNLSIYKLCLEVAHFLRPPHTLYHPSVIFQLMLK